MSADLLRQAVLKRIDGMNQSAMQDACNMRPSFNSRADALAMMVVDQLATARAFATCRMVIDDEYRRLMQPVEQQAPTKRKVEEVY